MSLDVANENVESCTNRCTPNSGYPCLDEPEPLLRWRLWRIAGWPGREWWRRHPTHAQIAIRQQSIDARERYGSLYDDIVVLLGRADPVGICHMDVNPDEYKFEAETILRRLAICSSADDVLTVVVEEFSLWFSPQFHRRERYREVSEQIWHAWERAKPLTQATWVKL